MNESRNQTIYFIVIGFLLSLLVCEVVYQQPEYEVEVVQAEFPLVTPEGLDLGRASSTISVKYLPSKPYTTLGEFSVTVRTKVTTPHIRTSIHSRDLRYKVTFWWRSKSIEERQGSYFGALNSSQDRVMYSYLSFPYWNRPMREIQSIYWKLNVDVEALFYNVTDEKILSRNQTTFKIFIIHPIVKILTFSLLIVVCFLLVIQKIRIDKLRLEKGFDLKKMDKRAPRTFPTFNIKRIKPKDPFLILSISLFAFELIIHYSGYDQLFTYGIYVAHHLAELPAFFFLGCWLARILTESNPSNIRPQIINAILYIGMNLILSKQGETLFIGGFLVSFPWLIGFYTYIFWKTSTRKALHPT